MGSWVMVLSLEGTVKSTSVNPPRDWGGREGERGCRGVEEGGGM